MTDMPLLELLTEPKSIKNGVIQIVATFSGDTTTAPLRSGGRRRTGCTRWSPSWRSSGAPSGSSWASHSWQYGTALTTWCPNPKQSKTISCNLDNNQNSICILWILFVSKVSILSRTGSFMLLHSSATEVSIKYF